MEAREALHTKGFVAINGQTLHGKALYVKAKAIRASRQKDGPAAAQPPVAASPKPRPSIAATAAGA